MSLNLDKFAPRNVTDIRDKSESQRQAGLQDLFGLGVGNRQKFPLLPITQLEEGKFIHYVEAGPHYQFDSTAGADTNLEIMMQLGIPITFGNWQLYIESVGMYMTDADASNKVDNIVVRTFDVNNASVLNDTTAVEWTTAGAQSELIEQYVGADAIHLIVLFDFDVGATESDLNWGHAWLEGWFEQV